MAELLSHSNAPTAGGPPAGGPPAGGPPPPPPMFVEETIINDGTYDGYTLLAPRDSKITTLVDNKGNIINQWKSDYTASVMAYLLENGNLLRVGSPGMNENPNIKTPFGGGIIQEFDWNGNLVWEYRYNNEKALQHHSIEPMPNGNVLVLAYEYKTKEEAIAAGRKPDAISQGNITPEQVVEIKKTGPKSGEIVWQWNVWDHLIQDVDSTKANFGVVADHPEKININFCPPGPNPTGADWNHASNASYNATMDQVIVGVGGFNEVWVIDHKTTKEEAKGPKGDLVFRWGNPSAYGAEGKATLSAPHNANILDDGTIAVINYGRERKFSSVDFIVPTKTIGLEASVESKYSDGKTMFSSFQVLPSGNAILCINGGKVAEVTPKGDVVWRYTNRDTGTATLKVGDQIPMVGDAGPKFPANYMLHALKYGTDYKAFVGKDLKPIK